MTAHRTTRRSWTYKTQKAASAETPSEAVALAKRYGYDAVQWSQVEYAHSIHAYVIYNAKGSKMLADPLL